MPTFRVTDPATGRTIRLTGDQAPTEQELEEIFASLPAQAPAISPTVEVKPPASPVLPGRIGEAASAISRAIPAPIAEFASGVVRGVTEGADFLTTGAVNAASQLVGSDFRVPTITGAAQSIGAGQGGFMRPGVAREVVQQAGEFTPAVAGVAAAAAGIPSLFSRSSPVRQKITELAQNGSVNAQRLLDGVSTNKPTAKALETAEGIVSGDRGTATRTITASGQVARDALAANAVKQGFDEGVIAAIKATSPSTRRKMRRMVDVLEEGKRNQRFAVVNRPTDVVGDAIGARVSTVKKANTEAGALLEKEAQALKGQRVQLSGAIDGFLNDLQALGVQVGDDFKPVFEGSDLEDISGAERVIKNVLKRVERIAVRGDAYEAHRLKRFIDEQVTFGKNTEGLAGRGESVLKKFRSSVDGVLDEAFEGYNQANIQYSETIRVLDAFQESAGRKIDLFGPNADKAVGTLSRRLMSNVQSRVQLLNTLDELEEVAGKYGSKADDDIIAMALFADELDAVFKPVARTSLGGELAKTAVTEGSGGVIRNAAGEAIEFARGINEENALRDIKRLLAR